MLRTRDDRMRLGLTRMSEDLGVKSALVVDGGLYPGCLYTAEFANRSPPKVAVLVRKVNLGADGKHTTEDANLRLELAVEVPPRQRAYLDVDAEFLTTLSPKSSHDRFSRLDCTPRQPPSLIAVRLAQQEHRLACRVQDCRVHAEPKPIVEGHQSMVPEGRSGFDCRRSRSAEVRWNRGEVELRVGSRSRAPTGDVRQHPSTPPGPAGWWRRRLHFPALARTGFRQANQKVGRDALTL